MQHRIMVPVSLVCARGLPLLLLRRTQQSMSLVDRRIRELFTSPVQDGPITVLVRSSPGAGAPDSPALTRALPPALHSRKASGPVSAPPGVRQRGGGLVGV